MRREHATAHDRIATAERVQAQAAQDIAAARAELAAQEAERRRQAHAAATVEVRTILEERYAVDARIEAAVRELQAAVTEWHDCAHRACVVADGIGLDAARFSAPHVLRRWLRVQCGPLMGEAASLTVSSQFAGKSLAEVDRASVAHALNNGKDIDA